MVDGVTGAALAALPLAPADGPSIAFADRPIGAIGNIRPPGPHLVAPSSALADAETVRDAPADLVLDTAAPEQSLFVRGQVRFADGTPSVGAIVRAHDCDVRRVEPLGKPVTTGGDGRYEIRYTAGDFARAEKGRADVRVTVQVEGREPVPGNIVFNAAPDAQVDVTLPWNAYDLSEFEALVQALQPLLANQGENGQDLALFALEESDVDFLTQDTGVPRERIDWLVRAARLARAENITPASPRTTKSAEPAGRQPDSRRGVLRLVPPRPSD